MSTLTKEWLHQTIADLEEERDAVPGVVNEDAEKALAAMKLALASLEAEAVGFIARHKETGKFGSYLHPKADWFKNDDYEVLSAYTAPPAPVSVPDDVSGPLAHAYKELTPTFMRNHIDVFERYGIYPDGSAGIQAMRIALDGMNRRAAMLQGAEQQNRQQNIPENIPVTQFKPVADLYGLTSPNGGETSFTFDAVEARDFIDGGWLCQEYVTLERYQEAMLQGAELVTTANKLPEQIKDNRLNSGAEADDYYSGYQAGWNECLESVQVICEGNPDAK